MPKVSVVIPTYNRADLIRETLASVLAQTFTDWECIVVDDGSIDDTEKVVAEFINRDPRFRYVRQENSSASRARNHGLALARGEYITFLDSDDLFLPDKLEWQVAALERDRSAVLVYGNTFHFKSGDPQNGYLYQWERTDRPSGWAFEALVNNSSIYSPLVRTGAMREQGGFDCSLPSAEDWDMWITLSKQGVVLFEPKVAMNYRLHEGNKSSNTLRNYTCAWRVVNKHLKGLPFGKKIKLYLGARRYFRTIYTVRMHEEAHAAASAGDWKTARKMYRAVAELNPRLLSKPFILLNAAWAYLPTDAAPIWQTLRRRSNSTADVKRSSHDIADRRSDEEQSGELID